MKKIASILLFAFVLAVVSTAKPVENCIVLNQTTTYAGCNCTLDSAYDNGRIIDGATSSSTAVEIGGASNRLKLYHNGTDGYIETSAGDLTLNPATKSGSTYVSSLIKHQYPNNPAGYYHAPINDEIIATNDGTQKLYDFHFVNAYFDVGDNSYHFNEANKGATMTETVFDVGGLNSYNWYKSDSGTTPAWKNMMRLDGVGGGLQIYDNNGIEHLTLSHSGSYGILRSHNGPMYIYGNNGGYGLEIVARGSGAYAAAHGITYPSGTGTEISIRKDQGSLPGYSTSYYPVVDTNGNYLYFSIGGNYAAYVDSSGNWHAVSSKKKKENFVDINESLLDKISQVEIYQYNYKNQSSKYKHIGPMAESFNQIFDTGHTATEKETANNKGMLSVNDVAGVALAGVKQLIKENEELTQQLGTANHRIEVLENKIDNICKLNNLKGC